MLVMMIDSYVTFEKFTRKICKTNISLSKHTCKIHYFYDSLLKKETDPE